METEPKDKYHGLRQRQGRNPHDRAIPDTLRQPDLRSTFKSVLKNFFFNSQAFGQVEELLSNLPFEQKSSLLKDLNVMRYIYMGRTEYSIMDSDNIGTGTIFDNQPKVAGSAVEKIDSVIQEIALPFQQSVPSDEEVLEVYLYYVKPNYQVALEPETPKKPGRFASQMAFSADKLAQMNKDLWLKNKRKK